MRKVWCVFCLLVVEMIKAEWKRSGSNDEELSMITIADPVSLAARDSSCKVFLTLFELHSAKKY